MEQLLLTAREAAACLGIGKSFFYKTLRTGDMLPPVKILGKNLWSYEELKYWIANDCPTQVEWKKKAHERMDRYRAMKVNSLSDAYVKEMICQGTKLKHVDIPKELVGLKRELMKIKRELKKQSN